MESLILLSKPSNNCSIKLDSIYKYFSKFGWIGLFLFVCFSESTFAELPKNTVSAIAFESQASGQKLKISLTFSQNSPKISLINDETKNPSIFFAETMLGPSVKPNLQPSGIVSSLDFKQSDLTLLLNFHAKSNVRVVVDKDGANKLSITLTQKGNAESEQNDEPVKNNTSQSERLDENTQIEVVFLKYADISEIVGVLAPGSTIKANDNFIIHEPGFGSAALGLQPNQPIQPIAEAPNQPLAQTINDVISVNRRLNAIILKGTPSIIASYKEKIAQLDLKVDSVILETIFVELSETGAKNIGIDFNNQNGQIGTMTYTTGAFMSSYSTGKYQKSAELQAAIYAQVQAGKGKIVSKPRISAQSGSSAKIITGNEIPIQTSILSGINNVVSTQVQYVNVGVTLQIAPRISEDGFVSSHVFCEVSSVTGTSNAGYPTVSQRSAETSATVRDGESFVIGGLTQDNESNSTSGIPLLKDIPVLGKVFQKESASLEKTNLYIVVTPHIIKKNEGVSALPN
jgi:general secretion pathway protein D